MQNSTDSEVLIAGAGPTGLVLALWLTKLGIPVRIIDKNAGPGTTSRALAVQARTLELYRQLDLADAVVAAGHKVPAFNFWAEGVKRSRIPFADTLDTLTPYPYIVIFPQDQHERLLVQRLTELGVTVERGTELLSFTQDADGVQATVAKADGTQAVYTARYIAGCDGARSQVRKQLGIDFAGGTYERFFYVADIEATGPAIDGELHINLDTAADFLAIFPLAGSNRARLVGTVLDDGAGGQDDHKTALTFDDVSAHATQRLKVTVQKLNWFSTYRVHHRVASRFREGRAFLLGDAGHIHSPAGGQGMNTGIGDAINLAWKLAAVLRGHAAAGLLDTYESERLRFARQLVERTDRVFTLATSDKAPQQFARTRIAPLVVPLIKRVPSLRRFAFRTVAQLALNYRHSALSHRDGAHAGGQVRGGDRLPWVKMGESDNFEGLRTPRWTVHVYGDAQPELMAWCAEKHVALEVFAWTDAVHAAGLSRDAAYLIRPDMYVASVAQSGLATGLAAYCSALQIDPSN